MWRVRSVGVEEVKCRSGGVGVEGVKCRSGSEILMIKKLGWIDLTQADARAESERC